MQINHCLILAAGLGTRMGEIGKKLPKVLWPVFEKSLLELQVAYAKSLGAEKIYINLHFMSREIEEFCKNRSTFEDVIFLKEEPEILDIGGAIHNLAVQVGYRGKLLILNADQFFYLKKESLQKSIAPFVKEACVLFSYKVNSSDGYNALEVSSDRVVSDIIKNKDLPRDEIFETYTGISYIDLSKLKKTPGVSAFFESVCPFKDQKVPAILLDNTDYWDFGTLNRYWKTCFRILETYSNNSTHPFLRFLVQEKALKTWKIGLLNSSYNAKSAAVINLNPELDGQDLGPSIILPSGKAQKCKTPEIYWKDMKEEVK